MFSSTFYTLLVPYHHNSVHHNDNLNLLSHVERETSIRSLFNDHNTKFNKVEPSHEVEEQFLQTPKFILEGSHGI